MSIRMVYKMCDNNQQLERRDTHTYFIIRSSFIQHANDKD